MGVQVRLLAPRRAAADYRFLQAAHALARDALYLLQL